MDTRNLGLKRSSARLHACAAMQGDGNTTGSGAFQLSQNPPGYWGYKSQPVWSAYRESSVVAGMRLLAQCSDGVRRAMLSSGRPHSPGLGYSIRVRANFTPCCACR